MCDILQRPWCSAAQLRERFYLPGGFWSSSVIVQAIIPTGCGDITTDTM